MENYYFENFKRIRTRVERKILDRKNFNAVANAKNHVEDVSDLTFSIRCKSPSAEEAHQIQSELENMFSGYVFWVYKYSPKSYDVRFQHRDILWKRLCQGRPNSI